MTAQAVKADRFAESERRRLLDENAHLRLELKERYELSNLVGNSGPMRQVYEQVAQVAKTNTTVLVRGESGTGKELIAHAIHYNSERAKKPFIKVNCAALPAYADRVRAVRLREGRVHRRAGAQEGPVRARGRGHPVPRRDRRAQPGHAGEAAARAAGARVRAVGGTETVKVERATDRRDQQGSRSRRSSERTFREDLYYRLNVFAIFVPPLRERKTDIMLLADHFLAEVRARAQARASGASRRRRSTCSMSYHWPGNVRELENTIERAVLVCDGNVDPRPSSAADAADRRGVRHRGRRHARRCGGEAREGSDPGRAQDGARQPRAGRASARQHRARHQLQDPKVRGGLRALPALRARALRPRPAHSTTYVAGAQRVWQITNCRPRRPSPESKPGISRARLRRHT